MASPPPNNSAASTPGKGGGAPKAAAVKPDRWGLIPVEKFDAKRRIEHAHPYWRLFHNHWKFLLDSYVGGDTYREACYGWDPFGMPVRNLRRHRREYPEPSRFPGAGYQQGFPGEAINNDVAFAAMQQTGPWPGMLGADPNATEGIDPYEFRRAATPVPPFVAEAVELHLSKLFGQEISRDTGGTDDAPGIPELDGPDGWWADVDGRGTSIDDWMRQTIAPLLAVLGNLDVCFDHPVAPPGEKVETRADELRLGLNKCVASYILPTNMIWWRLDGAGRYRECLVREFTDPCDRIDHDTDGNPIEWQYDGKDKGKAEAATNWRREYIRYRLWRPDESVLYDHDGEILERRPHSFGRVPVVRLIDVPMPEMPHVAKSRYGDIAEFQRAYYNLDSESIQNNTLQSSPLLCVPDKLLKADGSITVGINYALPMVGNADKGTFTAPTYISPPSDPSDNLRATKSEIVEAKDRRACLARPLAVRGGAGAKNGPSTDPQAAAAKQLDQIEGHDLLQSLAQADARAERTMAEYALLVCRDGRIALEKSGDPKAVKAVLSQITITYPSKFDLYAASDLIQNWTNLQKCLMAAGNLPIFEKTILGNIQQQLIMGLSDDDYDTFAAEADTFVTAKATVQEQDAEIGDAGYRSDEDALSDGEPPEPGAEADPTGETNVTAAQGGGYMTA